ncbi:hypothetical protein SDRG_13291 [Saprolegnia diclina VS20]|uniref:Transmembrane 9 superfamily member n=1 Tax=Saprolegnia diclina (strain VS20) TaxID=1156394 RepID=T0PTZ6_SAPDV|nr:hypothetical protein SDRG_13291 [Saprolegnia diclina VS20]EQC28954.1 hypothetical protein SDRG_13291 [Saprolegnia diclina VS20]|eukprot:XP_008617593.1 hypothetical protein SDRG_13291 [Saprolegnia diclina VS20]
MVCWRSLAVVAGGAALRFAAAEDAHEYVSREEVFVVANTIRPFSNPTETYHYYKLPFCKPKERQWDDHDLGELLTGSRKVVTDYRIFFGVDVTYNELCKVPFTPEVQKAFTDAVEEDFVFEMYVDDIRVSGQVGQAMQRVKGGNYLQQHLQHLQKYAPSSYDYYLNTHLHFDIAYNDVEKALGGYDGDEEVTSPVRKYLIVGINMTMTNSVETDENEFQYHLAEPLTGASPDIVFTYSVKWQKKSWGKYEDRLFKDPLLPEVLEIHWLSIINSFVLVMLLVAFLSIIMFRILKRDVSRYMDLEDGADLHDESGWKLVHADVFRNPPFLVLFCAFVGAGAQLFAMLFGVLVLSLLDVFHPSKRGGLVSAIVVAYALTAGVGGYRSASLYKQLGGQRWVWNLVVSGLVVPGPLIAIFAFLNTVAIWNDSSAALPFGTIMILLCLFLLVNVPLAITGGIAGRNLTAPYKPPCRTNKIQREIPMVPWYRRPIPMVVAAGCLPYSAVYIELHHIFAAIWGHQIYTLFGILFLAFVMLVCVTAFMTITMTYFQLAAEDHRWWWRSFWSGGITGVFVLAYSVWYFATATEMTGFFQAAFYFGYSLMMAYCFFIMLGFIGFQSALLFVRKIYTTIKVE